MNKQTPQQAVFSLSTTAPALRPVTKRIAVAVCLLLTAALPLGAGEISVSYANNGLPWSVPEAWIPSVVPNNGGGNVYNVTIARPGGGTNPIVELNEDAFINDLTLTFANLETGPGGAHDLTVESNFTANAGTISGDGIFTTEGTVNLNSLTISGGRICNNAGSWTGGALTLDNGNFNNQTGAVFNLTGSAIQSSNGGHFNNLGTLNANNRTIAGSFNNSGVVNGGGTFNGPGSHTGGFIAPGAALFFSGGGTFGDTCTIQASALGFSGGSYNVGGSYDADTLQFFSSSDVTISNPPASTPPAITFYSGHANFNGGLPEVGGIGGLAGNLSITGNTLVTGDFAGVNTLSGPGTLTVEGTTTLPANLGMNLTIAGDASFKNVTFSDGATLTVLTGATLNATATFQEFNGAGALNVDGTFDLYSGSSGPTRVNIPTTENDTGTVNVRHPTELNAPVSLNGMVLIQGSNGTLFIRDGGYIGGDVSLENDAALTLANDGMNPSVYVFQPNSSLSGSNAIVRFVGGGASGPATTVNVAAGYYLAGESSTTVDGAGVTISNETQNVNLGETVEIANGGSLTLFATSNMTIAGDLLTVRGNSTLITKPYSTTNLSVSLTVFFNALLFNEAVVDASLFEGLITGPKMAVRDADIQGNTELQSLELTVETNLDVAATAQVSLDTSSALVLDTNANATFGPGASVIGEGTVLAREATVNINAPADPTPFPPYSVPPVNIRSLELDGTTVMGAGLGLNQDQLNLGTAILKGHVNIVESRLEGGLFKRRYRSRPDGGEFGRRSRPGDRCVR